VLIDASDCTSEVLELVARSAGFPIIAPLRRFLRRALQLVRWSSNKWSVAPQKVLFSGNGYTF
jgi:hypothetical protein